MATPTVNNTILPPVRLTGDPKADLLAIQRWINDFYQQLVVAQNVLGQLSILQAQVAQNTADIATIKQHLGI